MGIIVSLILLALLAWTFIHAITRRTPSLPPREETSLKELVNQVPSPRVFTVEGDKVCTAFPRRQPVSFAIPPYLETDEWRALLEYVYKVTYQMASKPLGARRNGNRCVVVFVNTDYNDGISMGLVPTTTSDWDSALNQRLTDLSILIETVAKLAEEDRIPV